MNIIVCIKQVPDTETKIKVSSDKTWIDTAGVKWIVSSYDEFAIEEALRIREKNAGSQVTVISAGPERVTEALRTALAMGCDHAIRVDIPERADCFLAAKALAGAIKKNGVIDLVLTGKEAIDDGAAQTPPLLAEFLGIPAVTVVLANEYGSGQIKCKREIEGGAFELVEVKLPAMISTQKGMNEPRYASLPNIMKAKKKEIKTFSLADSGASEADQKIRLKNFDLPPPKQAGKKLTGDIATQAKELVRLLHEEAKVI